MLKMVREICVYVRAIPEKNMGEAQAGTFFNTPPPILK